MFEGQADALDFLGARFAGTPGHRQLLSPPCPTGHASRTGPPPGGRGRPRAADGGGASGLVGSVTPRRADRLDPRISCVNTSRGTREHRSHSRRRARHHRCCRPPGRGPGRAARRGDLDRRHVRRLLTPRRRTADGASCTSTRLELDPQVALRPEPFGALAYHYGNRRLVFLGTRHGRASSRRSATTRPSADALEACGIDRAALAVRSPGRPDRSLESTRRWSVSASSLS